MNKIKITIQLGDGDDEGSSPRTIDLGRSEYDRLPTFPAPKVKVPALGWSRRRAFPWGAVALGVAAGLTGWLF